MKRIYAIFFALLAGCSSVEQKTEKGPLYTYRADMYVQLGDKGFDGMAVTKLDGALPIRFISPVGIDRVQVTTCARQAVCQSGGVCDPAFKIDKDWLGNVKNSFVFNYVPVAAETEGLCPMYIEAYSKKQLTSWGFVAFRKDETLPAHIDCNGQGWTFAGVSVCQSKNSLEQTITFKQPVKIVPEPNCNFTQKDAQTYTAKPDIGFCRATFATYDQPRLWHRLILLGYDAVLVRVQ